MITNSNSFDRIVSYFHALARSPFVYYGRHFAPYARLAVSPKVFQSYTCPSGCGACCHKVSLVFDRARPSDLPTLPLEELVINGKSLSFPVDRQTQNDKSKCQHLTAQGRCGIYEIRPLPCRFEFFRFLHITSRSTVRAVVGVASRKWVLTKVGGTKGGLCELRPYDAELTRTHIRDLRIIESWMTAFDIQHDCEAVLSYLHSGPHTHPLVIKRPEAQGLI